MGVMIRIVRPAAAGMASSYDGLLLKGFDPEAHNGRGELTVTNDPAKALRFASKHEATVFWMQVPRCQPTRADGAPNRPLTFFTMVTEPAPDA